MCPIGAFLSGGVDSSLVVALMAKETSKVQDVLDRLRRARLRRTAACAGRGRVCGTDHHEFIVRPDAAQRSSTELIEPFRRAVCRRVGDSHVVRVADGEPARDGGAVWRRRRRALRGLRPVSAARDCVGVRSLTHRAGLAAWRPSPPGHLCRTVFAAGISCGTSGSTAPRALSSTRSRSLQRRGEACAPLQKTIVRQLRERETGGIGSPAKLRTLRAPPPGAASMMRFDGETLSAGRTSLTKVDRMSMAHSIESRVPLARQ